MAAPGVLSNDDDAEGDPLSATLEEGPANGVLDFDSDGSFVYIPEENTIGLVTFRYRVSDEHGGSDSAVVRIDVYARFYLPLNLQN